MNLSDHILQNDARYRAALRHQANIGAGFEVGRARAYRGTVKGHFIAIAVGIFLAAMLIGAGL